MCLRACLRVVAAFVRDIAARTVVKHVCARASVRPCVRACTCICVVRGFGFGFAVCVEGGPRGPIFAPWPLGVEIMWLVARVYRT